MSGDILPQGESAIVISNHVSWTDFYMIQALAVRAGMLGRCRWFSKIELRWVPLLGWGIWAMGMPMVSRNWLKDKKELDRVFSGVVVQKWPTCKMLKRRFTEKTVG
jgi:1-acyl-sn-glycerol-3-phosphate acyltransferase